MFAERGEVGWHTLLMSVAPTWKVLLSPPDVGAGERQLLLDAFDSNWIAPAGPDLAQFEHELSVSTGTTAAAALSSGTAALQLALMGLGVGAGDDVLVSTLTFGASAFAPTYLGARPCFIDCESDGWQIDPNLVEVELDRRASVGELPAALIAVDLYGAMCDGEALVELCDRYEVPLVVDAAESLGARRSGRPAGCFGAVSTLSFNGNKIVTTGGGGALVSDRVDLVERARYLSTQARRPAPWYEHDEIGHNFRLGNLNAAVGRGQLRTLDERIASRRRVRATYERRLSGLGLGFQVSPSDAEPNHWLTTVVLPADLPVGVADVLGALHAEGIEGRYGFKPMHLQPVFEGHPVVGGAVSASLFERSISLPSGSSLDDATVEWIADVVCRTIEGS